jgi:hypothetical protein
MTGSLQILGYADARPGKAGLRVDGPGSLTGMSVCGQELRQRETALSFQLIYVSMARSPAVARKKCITASLEDDKVTRCPG